MLPSFRFRRRAILRAAVSAVGLGVMGGASLGWYSRIYEPGHLEIVRRQVVIPRLPAAFTGMTIGQMSDLHVGHWVDATRVRAAVDGLLALSPSLIAVTGDFVSRVADGEAEVIARELSRLRAPLGTFAILGNYDYLADHDIVAAAVQRAGLTLLRNTNVPLDRAGHVVYLAGIDDALEGKPDLDLALRGVPDDVPAILLAHEPDVADAAAHDPRIVLQLSGHSHGGQVRLPEVGPLYLPELGRHYPLGLYQVKGMQVYTSRGIGVVGVPVRFNCRPEVTLFELIPA